MLLKSVTPTSVPSLHFLVRKAYRSLHFYNADVCSSVVAALGDLSEKPLSAHAMVLSLLTIIPEFEHANHVVQVLQGLSQLRIHHTMLTAHLLKRYLRCCFSKTKIKPTTITTASLSSSNVAKYTFPILNESSIEMELFLSSCVSILQILEHYEHPSHLVDSFFEAIEELLQTGYGFSLQCFHHIYHNNVNEIQISTIGINSRNKSDDIFFLMCSFIRLCRRRRRKRLECKFFFIEHLLASFVDDLCLRHVVSLLSLMEESCVDWRDWKISSYEKEEKSNLQLLLLQFLLCRLKPEDLLPGLLTIDEVIVLLRNFNRYTLNEISLSSEMQDCLHRLAHALSLFVEKTLFTFNVVYQLAASDVLTWNERHEAFHQEFLTLSIKWQLQPRLEPFLDRLQHMLYGKEEHNSTVREKLDITETLLVLCHRLLLFHVVYNRNASTETLHRVCEFTTTALGNLCFHLESLESSVKQGVFGLTIPVKALLQLHISTFSPLKVKNKKNYSSALLGMLIRYELLNNFNNCSFSNVPHNIDLFFLYKLLCGRQPSRELLTIIDDVLPTICSEKNVKRDTAEILVKVLCILRSKEWVQFCGSDVYWIKLCTSVRLSESIKLLVPLFSPCSSEKETKEEGHRVFEVLRSLLETICPLERYMGIINGNDGCILTRIPTSHGVLNVVNRLLQACKNYSIKKFTMREVRNNFLLPTVDTPVLAERLSLQSRSSKIWQMAKCSKTNDQYWSEYGKNNDTEEEIVSSCMEIQKWQNMLAEFALWLGAFQCGLQINHNDRYVATIQMEVDINLLRELHTEVLDSATHLVLCNKEGATIDSQRTLLHAIYLNLQYKRSSGELSNISVLLNDEEFIRIVTLMVVDLYRIFVLSVKISTNTFDMNAEELRLLLVHFTESFDNCEKPSRSMHVLRSIVWESLIQIIACGSLSLMDNNDITMFATQRNTLLCALLLLACFLQSPKNTLDASILKQRSATEEAITELVGVVSRYTPVLRRSRPAPESLLALTLFEMLENHRDMTATTNCISSKRRIEKMQAVLVGILHREQKHLSLWEDAFCSVAERIKKYW
ncbi:hypothetical protein LSM04_003812 [Trypanosoma melophagium]|uniref:uncharacterized protein n=1 Tax=Trypanosoma melophagium TaxID=715481 RepID=UPI00351A9F31|nr:hypothetical protein LSM04_003812 [Trypanosoma melophagium]